MNEKYFKLKYYLNVNGYIEEYYEEYDDIDDALSNVKHLILNEDLEFYVLQEITVIDKYDKKIKVIDNYERR